MNSNIFIYFTLFKSNFVNITLDNYSQVKTINLKILLFIIVSNTILTKYKIFNLDKETTKVVVLKL